MFKKAIREIAVFVFYTGLIIYFLVYCFFNFLIDSFANTKIRKLILFTQKCVDSAIQSVLVFIIEKLEKRNLWY